MTLKRLTLLLVFCCCSVSAQEFKAVRYDDDFRYLAGDHARSLYNRFKYAALDEHGIGFLSFGGEVRLQYFRFWNEDWGEATPDPNGYILNRSLLHADLHASEAFRFFAQWQSSLAPGRINPGPVEKNGLDLHQAFIDISFMVPEVKFTLRAGRQEMMFGEQRLISVREFPNSRLAFDGFRVSGSRNDFKLEGFYMHPVANRPLVFDDDFNDDVKIWGSYATLVSVPVLGNIDLYGIGMWKREAAFDDARDKELRHSTGIRLWDSKGNWQYDLEAVIQLGKLGGNDILGWAISSNTSYRFASAPLRPKIGLKADAISGDRRRNDGKLGTFNALYPKGAYFGSPAVIGPSNLFCIHPELTLEPERNIRLVADYGIFRRFSANDGIYAPNGELIYPGESEAMFVGTQLSAALSWKPVVSFLLKFEGMWFDAGSFLKAAGRGKDIFFAGITTQFKF